KEIEQEASKKRGEEGNRPAGEQDGAYGEARPEGRARQEGKARRLAHRQAGDDRVDLQGLENEAGDRLRFALAIRNAVNVVGPGHDVAAHQDETVAEEPGTCRQRRGNVPPGDAGEARGVDPGVDPESLFRGDL